MGSAVDILKLTKTNKASPGMKALADVDLTVRGGEVLALIGENGTGESTLMKVLSGVYREGSGTIEFEGREVKIHSPKQPEELDISTIYQKLNLIQRVTVAENVFLGRYPMKVGTVQWRKMREDAKELLDDLGIKMDVRAMLRELSLAQQQIVEIMKAVSINAKVVIMDKPASSLSHNKTEISFRIIRMLRERGTAVILIAHRLDEVYTICDRIIVLRDDYYIGVREVKEVTKANMIEMMIRRQLTNQYPQRGTKIGKTALKVRGLSNDRKRAKEVSFAARSSEVLGFVGSVGVGRTKAIRMIFGADKRARGEIFIGGKQVFINSPRDATGMGIGFVTENRKEEGLFLRSSVKVNIAMVALEKVLKVGFYFDFKKEKQVAEEYVKLFHTTTLSMEQRVMFLSGGNQQKVVLTKWLFSGFKIIIFDRPTRGIDVGAEHETYEVTNKLVSEDKTVIVVSSDLEEIMGTCDRILVIHEGVISGEVEKAEFSRGKIIEYAVGGS